MFSKDTAHFISSVLQLFLQENGPFVIAFDDITIYTMDPSLDEDGRRAVINEMEVFNLLYYDNVDGRYYFDLQRYLDLQIDYHNSTGEFFRKASEAYLRTLPRNECVKVMTIFSLFLNRVVPKLSYQQNGNHWFRQEYLEAIHRCLAVHDVSYITSQIRSYSRQLQRKHSGPDLGLVEFLESL